MYTQPATLITNPKNSRENIGVKIGLMTLFNTLGHVPHPESLCENPQRQAELELALHKLNIQIPDFFHWTSTDIGYYDEDKNFISEAELEDEKPNEETQFYIWWK